jgi:hypothetical protein
MTMKIVQVMKGVTVAGAVLASLWVSETALAAKPDGAGNSGAQMGGAKAGDMMRDRDSEQEQDMERDRDRDRDHDREQQGDGAMMKQNEMRKEKREDGDDEAKPGLAKQREMKMEQERKELGKGSEQGQTMREEHSRKWWRFWE